VTSILNADLHCHSVVSDGTLTPEALAERAASHGVELWALTDHDEIGGQARAAAAAKAVGMRYVTGVEISVTFLGKTVHIVGLGMDTDNAGLCEGLERTRGGRRLRAQEMSDGLARVGIRGAFEGALRYVGNPDLISRTHFARHLVETGVCKDTNEVFRKYLTEGKPGYVEHRWATLQDAVRWITQADGMAIVAHPARYKFTANEEFALFTEFKGQAGAASRSSRAAIRQPSTSATPLWHKSLGWPPRVAAISTAPTKAIPNWAPCPTCLARSRRCGNCCPAASSRARHGPVF